MNLQKIKDIDKVNLFKGHSSLKEWNLKNLEGFLIKDGFYFNEYGKVSTDNIIKEFIKKNKKKGLFLHDIIKKGDISLNFTGHITCASWLGFTLDKISFISLGYRRKIKMMEITTNDGYSITVTKNKKLLTNNGYVESKDLKKGIDLIGIMGSSYNGFKNGGSKKEFTNINKLLLEIKELILMEEDNKIQIKKLDNSLSHYLNILGIQTAKQYIKLDEVELLLKSLEGKNDLDEIEFLLGGDNNYKSLFLRQITEIKEVEVEEAYIGSVISKLANNYIINNIILEK